MPIGVITNPLSRRNRRNPHMVRELAYILGDNGKLATPTDLAALRQVCATFRERQVDVVAINGGDGTNHRVLTELVRTYDGAPLPKIALLRGGTMNTAAHGLGIKGSPHVLLGRLTDRYHAGDPLPSTHRNLVIVNGEHAGFIFGNGLIGRFLEAYYQGSDPSPAKAARLLARAGVSALVGGAFAKQLAAPTLCRVTLDGVAWPELPWITVGVAGVDDIGLGFRPFYKAPHNPGFIHAVGIGCSPAAMAGDLWRIFRARPTKHPDIVDALAKRVTLESTDGSPMSFMIDGDFHPGSQSVTIEAGPLVELVLL